MNVLKYRVSLDMFDTLSQITIKAKKGDSACQIHFTLTENGKIYNISDGCYATFSGKKADGNFVYGNCTIEGNTIVYDFSSSIDDDGFCQLTACEGNVECEVALFKDSNKLTTPRFTLVVDGTVYNGEEIVSTPSVNAVKKLIDESVLSINGELNIWQHDTLDGLYIIRGGTQFIASLRDGIDEDGNPTYQILANGSIASSDVYAYVYTHNLYEKRCFIYGQGISCFSITSKWMPKEADSFENGVLIEGMPAHYEDTFEDISNEIIGSQGGGDASNKMDKFGRVFEEEGAKFIQLDNVYTLRSPDGRNIVYIGSDGTPLFETDIVMCSKKITSLGTPTDDADAVNKNYVDTAIGSIDSALDSIIAIQNSILGGGA